MCIVWREVGVFDGISRWLCTAHLNQPSDLDLKTHRPRKKIGSSLPCLAAAWVWTEHESWDQICFPFLLNERRTPNRDFYKEGMRGMFLCLHVCMLACSLRDRSPSTARSQLEPESIDMSLLFYAVWCNPLWNDLRRVTNDIAVFRRGSLDSLILIIPSHAMPCHAMPCSNVNFDLKQRALPWWSILVLAPVPVLLRGTKRVSGRVLTTTMPATAKLWKAKKYLMCISSTRKVALDVLIRY